MWTGAVKDGTVPGFDLSFSNPAFVELLQTGAAEGKVCLVPGCGRGYDVVEMVRHGATCAVGLEIAQTAVDSANEWRDKHSGLDHDAMKSKASFHLGDFFTGPSGEENKTTIETTLTTLMDEARSTPPFTLGYDYTFFCAIHPEMRKDWGKAWASWLAPGGQLITLMFPCAQGPEAPSGMGPPFQVRPEDYVAALEEHFTLESVVDIPENLSPEKRKGREKMGKWIRK